VAPARVAGGALQKCSSDAFKKELTSADANNAGRNTRVGLSNHACPTNSNFDDAFNKEDGAGCVTTVDPEDGQGFHPGTVRAE
jgi:hypothetical protein